MSEPPIRLLFLCTENSCRSQIAEGLAQTLGKGHVEAFSAGTHPKEIHPLAMEAMRLVGIDISRQRSKHIDELRDQEFDYVITVCDRAKEQCPSREGTRDRLHWSFEDPALLVADRERQLKRFERIRDEIRARLHLFLTVHGFGENSRGSHSS
jgi:arsenate reductase